MTDDKKFTTNTVLKLLSTQLSRMRFAQGTTHGGERDLYKVLGYNTAPNINHYMFKYRHQDVAKRIVNAYPDISWSRKPTVQNSDDVQSLTEFEKAFNALALRTKMFDYLARADKLAGLGRYSILLIGVAGSSNMRTPVTPQTDESGLLYFMAFSESNARIEKYDENVTSPRYGKPEMYEISVGQKDQTDDGATTTKLMPSKKFQVHHSRILHIAEGALENDIFGVPKLEAIYNRLDDLEKVVGGASELYWINGRGGINFNVDKDFDLIDEERFTDHIEDYVNNLSRALRTKGMDVKPIEMKVSDPSNHVSVLIDLIAGATGIPKRILVGSERGELASTQDEQNWYSRVEERRMNHCEQWMLRPLIDKLMELNILPSVDEYQVVWPELLSAEKERSENAVRNANAIAIYANAQGAEFVIPTEQFVEEVMHMDYREDDVNKLLEDERRDELLAEPDPGQDNRIKEQEGDPVKGVRKIPVDKDKVRK